MMNPDLLPDEATSPALAPIAERLADEGVPVRAIARALKHPAEGIRAAIADGIYKGRILLMPKDDWPVGQSREDRHPSYTRATRMTDETLINGCIRLFKVTKLQAALLASLLVRNEVNKDTMHQIIESRRTPGRGETDVKMVDVVICNLRKRLRPFNYTIKTLWACGYYMLPADRKDILDKVNEHVVQNTVKETAAPDAAGVGGPTEATQRGGI